MAQKKGQETGKMVEIVGEMAAEFKEIEETLTDKKLHPPTATARAVTVAIRAQTRLEGWVNAHQNTET